MEIIKVTEHQSEKIDNVKKDLENSINRNSLESLFSEDGHGVADYFLAEIGIRAITSFLQVYQQDRKRRGKVETGQTELDFNPEKELPRCDGEHHE